MIETRYAVSKIETLVEVMEWVDLLIHPSNRAFFIYRVWRYAMKIKHGIIGVSVLACSFGAQAEWGDYQRMSPGYIMERGFPSASEQSYIRQQQRQQDNDSRSNSYDSNNSNNRRSNSNDNSPGYRSYGGVPGMLRR